MGLFRTLFSAIGLTHPSSWWTLQNAFTFNCGAALRAKLSAKNVKVATWRYRYFGDFPNLRLVGEGEGAWHGSEIITVFGTDLEVQNQTARTREQDVVGRYVQGAWAAFVKDPEGGLRGYGWPKYDSKSKTLVRLGYENRAGPNLAAPADYDFSCPWIYPLGMALLSSNSSQTAVDVIAGMTRPIAEQMLSLFDI